LNIFLNWDGENCEKMAQMENKNTLLTLTIIFLCLAFAMFILIPNKVHASKNDVLQITSNAILYTQEGCHYCEIQKEKFGEFYELLNITDCFENPEKCLQANIIAFPSWIIRGEIYKGVFEVDELKELTENGK